MRRTAAGELKNDLEVEFFENVSLELNKIVRNQKSKQRIARRVEGNVQSDELDKLDDRVDNCVCIYIYIYIYIFYFPSAIKQEGLERVRELLRALLMRDGRAYINISYKLQC